MNRENFGNNRNFDREYEKTEKFVKRTFDASLIFGIIIIVAGLVITGLIIWLLIALIGMVSS